MEQKYYLKKQIVEIFGLDDRFLDELEAEDLIRSHELEPGQDRVFSREDVERIRIITNLVRHLDVNLPGVEVILEMRSNMIRMQHQFDEILSNLVEELKRRLV
jgi:MerR family transcriptional regulator/heat shock protein HspR